jgi:hypothetical protein
MAILNLNITDFVVFASLDDSIITIPLVKDISFLKKFLYKLKFNYFVNMLHYVCVNE